MYKQMAIAMFTLFVCFGKDKNNATLNVNLNLKLNLDLKTLRTLQSLVTLHLHAKGFLAGTDLGLPEGTKSPWAR